MAVLKSVKVHVEATEMITWHPRIAHDLGNSGSEVLEYLYLVRILLQKGENKH